MSEEHPKRVDAYFVAGGKWHDIDFARVEILKLLAEHPYMKVKVASNWDDIESISASDFLISYTCDVRPSEASQHAVRDWVEAGGRFIALHGTNSALDLPRPNGVESPRCFPHWAETLGSQFVAHPPIAPYPVKIADDSHWLVEGVEPFETDDELYLMEYADRDALQVQLHTHWSGDCGGFEESDWSVETRGTDEHLIQYLRPLGKGSVLYNTLGHCRSHWDMVPLADYYPTTERCSWEKPQYYELLRRAIRWGLGHDS